MISIEQLRNEIEQLETIKKETISELKKKKAKVQDGVKLRVSKHRNGYQFYIRSNCTEKSGTYIRKKDHVIAENLAQIEYDEKLLVYINNRLAKIKALEYDSTENPYKYVLDKMPVSKQSLIKTPFVSDEQYILEWLSQKYDVMGFRTDSPEYYTRKGLRVRSKSEKIIADMLDSMEMPYLYEKPLRLSNGNTVYPDFTLLDIKEHKERYWEHFGMMDDYEYRNNAFLKIKCYESDGIYQGVGLITTIESSKYPINTKAINGMIEHYRYEFGYLKR